MRKNQSGLVSIVTTGGVFLSTIVSCRAFTWNPTIASKYAPFEIINKQQRQFIEQQSADNDGDGDSGKTCRSITLSRRNLFTSHLVASGILPLLFLPKSALAGIDVSSLKSIPIEGDATGATARLRQLQEQGTRTEQRSFTTPINSAPTTKLSSGVTYRDIQVGKDGGRKVQRGSRVGVEMTIRAKSLATESEPDGPMYFSTKRDTSYNELTWEIGAGDAVKGLEEGMMGMRLNAVRRIEVPSQQIFAARNAFLLPEPTTEDGKRIYEDCFKTDATLVFEVFTTAIKQNDNRI